MDGKCCPKAWPLASHAQAGSDLAIETILRNNGCLLIDAERPAGRAKTQHDFAMSSNSENAPPTPPGRLTWVLRRADQLAIAILVLVALVSMVGWWIAHGGLRGELVEFHQGPRRTIRFVVDINQADAAELAQIPGVGEKLAARIVAYRNTHGPFRAHDELRRVPGIGQKTLQSMQPYLRPLPPQAAPDR